MSAKEMFEKIGYEEKIHTSTVHPSFSGIRYTKMAPKSHMEQIGMVSKKEIEFYPSTKEILLTTSYQHRDGSITKSDAVVLSIDELQAVKKQVEELEWKNE